MIELTKELADAVALWMQRHGLTQTVVAARGGPSTTSMTKITYGRGSVRPGSLADLDKGLGWGHGVAVQYNQGNDPLGLFRAHDAPAGGVVGRAAPGGVGSALGLPQRPAGRGRYP